MNSNAVCEYLEWDSQFFGRRIARANISYLTEDLVAEIDAWCSSLGIDCLYFLAGSTDRQTARLAQVNEFRLVDVKLTLELQVGPTITGDSAVSRVRSATEGDIPALRAIARTSHRDSRFYYDRNFPSHLCDELYATWIQRSCQGWATKVFVAGENEVIDGYVTCNLPNRFSAQIGLVGVADVAQGKGIGSELVSYAVRWFAQEGVEKVTVVTQGRNVRAQRLYQRSGFVTRSVDLWFHRWFSETRKNS